jgi:hypothetical protein
VDASVTASIAGGTSRRELGRMESPSGL